MTDLTIKNARILRNGKLTDADINVHNGKIKTIRKRLHPKGKVVNVNGRVVLPGGIDSHVHFRHPGGSHKETWRNR